MTIDYPSVALNTVTSLCAVLLAVKRYINGGVKRIESKLDVHIEKVDGNFGELGTHVSALKEDMAGVKGYLGIGMPSRNVH